MLAQETFSLSTAFYLPTHKSNLSRRNRASSITPYASQRNDQGNLLRRVPPDAGHNRYGRVRNHQLYHLRRQYRPLVRPKQRRSLRSPRLRWWSCSRQVRRSLLRCLQRHRALRVDYLDPLLLEAFVRPGFFDGSLHIC